MRASAPRSGSKRGSDLLAPALLLLAAFAAYHASFSVPFFFDDVVAITNNPTIRSLSRMGDVLSPPDNGSGTTGRPLVNLSLAINYALGGTNVRGYHVLNLLLHAVATITLFGLVRRTLSRPTLWKRLDVTPTGFAFFVALLWTVHPLQTESVACVIQRTELLVGMFYLLTLYGFVRSQDSVSPRRWLALSIASCAFGMASKEVMVSAPLMVLLFDRTFVGGSFRAAWGERRRFYLGLAATWLVLVVLIARMGGSRAAAAGFGLGVTWWSYALKQCEAIVTYLLLALWPHPLIVDYGTEVISDPLRVAPQVVIVVVLVLLMLAALRWRPVVGFLLFWACAILAPSSSVVPLVSQTMAEHRMYLPLAAVIALGAGTAVARFGKRSAAVAGVVIVALFTLTLARVQTMQDEVGLWLDTITKLPANSRAHGALGLALSDQGRVREALPHFQRALELDPKSVATEQNIGNAYYRLGEFAAAREHYQRAVALDPKFASGFNGLGAALWELHEVDGALQAYRTSLSLDPHHLGAQQNIARALFALGRFADAARHYAEVAHQQPTSPNAHYDLGLALARAGEIDQAARHFAAALQLKPSAVSYLNYARFLANAGRTADAMAALETALRLQPDLADARHELERLKPSP